jgi:catechol 2,3-dioxygenase-like lactoylglutathione lyase family enzyme
MLTDRWDVSHVCIAVPDLEVAMGTYTEAFGIEWGTVLHFSEEGLVVSPEQTMEMTVVAPGIGEGASMEGLREVCSTNGGGIAAGLPVAALELAHAAGFSPASTLWGCPDGREYVHHISYWVDDMEAESRSLMDKGFTLEITTAPGDVARGFGYLVSPAGLRIELSDRSTKAAVARYYTTGVLDFETVGA